MDKHTDILTRVEDFLGALVVAFTESDVITLDGKDTIQKLYQDVYNLKETNNTDKIIAAQTCADCDLDFDGFTCGQEAGNFFDDKAFDYNKEVLPNCPLKKGRIIFQLHENKGEWDCETQTAIIKNANESTLP